MLYASMLLDKLRNRSDLRADLIISHAGARVWEYELPEVSINSFPFRRYQADDLFAAPASGSSNYMGMIIVPCSMGSLARMANGISNDLMTRAADVMLKERKKLILVTREAPLSQIHLRNMLSLTEAGAIVCPASPGFYHKPANMEELLNNTVERVLSLAGIESERYQWGNDAKN